MKLILEKVKIYGFDPNVFKSFDNGGKETKQYSVGLCISEQQRELIDSYIYGKCMNTNENEILFYGKNKQPIPVFDPEKNKITTPINEVFIADASILIDEFTDKDGNIIRYSKCLGIHYVEPVPDETPKIIVQENYTTFDEIFGGEVGKCKDPDFSSLKTKEEMYQPTASSQSTDSTFEPTIPPMNDLPF